MVFVFAYMFAFAVYGPSRADEKDDAINASAKFAKAITDGDLDATYAKTSPRFQTNMPKASFTERLGMMRIQLGGPMRTWSLVGAQSLSHLPATGEAGNFYYVRLRAFYAATTIIYDFMLEKTNNEWGVLTFYTMIDPATQQQQGH